jgi:hypothetical protein
MVNYLKYHDITIKRYEFLIDIEITFRIVNTEIVNTSYYYCRYHYDLSHLNMGFKPISFNMKRLRILLSLGAFDPNVYMIPIAMWMSGISGKEGRTFVSGDTSFLDTFVRVDSEFVYVLLKMPMLLDSLVLALVLTLVLDIAPKVGTKRDKIPLLCTLFVFALLFVDP